MKVKVTFEFGDNDIPPVIVTEEFAQEEDLNFFIAEAEKLKVIDDFNFQFNYFIELLGTIEGAIYWFELWPCHEHYGCAHITYIEKG